MGRQERARQYIQHFRGQLALVESLRGNETIHVGSGDPAGRLALHKKILYTTILDSLAMVRYSTEDPGNRERFTCLLRDHSTWSTGALVSVPLLVERLSHTSSTLGQHLVCVLAKYSTDRGNSLPITAFDVAAGSIECLTEDSAEKRLIPKCLHYELFYCYRNYIVHEFREPGYGGEPFAESDEPRYHTYGGEGRWRLLYPESFFRSLAASILSSLEHYYCLHDIDPYERIEDSSAW